MTEHEWLASTDPWAMLRHLAPDGPHPDPVHRGPRPRLPSARKLRLFACACCRQVWDEVLCGRCEGERFVWEDYLGGAAGKEPRVCEVHCPDCRGTGRALGLTDPRSRAAVEVAERYADGLATEEERLSAHVEVKLFAVSVKPLTMLPFIAVRKEVMLGMDLLDSLKGSIPPIIQADLLRCLFGNPFRPTPTIDPAWMWANDRAAGLCAEGIYEERAWDALPILADALEEAECDDAGLLAHLRSHGPHARGCWVLDSLLGKE